MDDIKAIIAGGRDFVGSAKHEEWLDKLRFKLDITEVVSGGCRGADKFGERFAIRRGIRVTLFKADWSKLGKIAGPLRNADMVDYADVLILFPGGAGTDNIRRCAMRRLMQIIDWEDVE